MSHVGLPVKLLYEAQGHTVTLELVSGEVYRGLLSDVEDNMNCQLTQVACTQRDGRTTQLEHVYIRGSKVRYVIVPDMFRNAPMFQRLDAAKAAARGRGAGYGIATGKAAAAAGSAGSGFGHSGRRGGFGGGRGGGRT